MRLMEILLNPVSIVFIALIFGCVLGHIKCFGLSLDLAGVLIVAVVLGCVATSSGHLSDMIDIAKIKNDMKLFSTLGTSLFVSAIALATSYSLDFKKPKMWRALLIGSLMVMSSFVLLNLIAILDRNASYSQLLGAFCGALTTTPGLSAVSDLKDVIAEDATLGYGCTYLIGVIAAVLCTQIISQRNETRFSQSKKDIEEESRFAVGGLIQIGITVIFGRLLGTVSLGGFSLGQSGGILCAGLVLGAIVKKLFLNKIVSAKEMEIYRNLGLVFFFAGNGFSAGISLGDGVDIKVVLYGTLMAIVPIAIGAFLSKLIVKNNDTPSIVAGGMTSSPAMGALLRRSYPLQVDSYLMAYLGALLTTVFLIRLL